jgi:sporulation protein YlmC with PRC-barrel domain
MRTTLVGAFTASTVLVFVSVNSARAADGNPKKPVVAQQCLDDLQKFGDQLTRVGFGVPPPGNSPPQDYDYGVLAPTTNSIWGIADTPHERMRALRDAAYVYALDGNEQSCQAVLASMQKVYEEHQETFRTATGDPNARTAWRRAHLASAKPVAEMNHMMRADLLIGSEVRNLKDDSFGEIEDFIINPEKGEVLYVLVSHGGFLGFGKKLVAVRWSDLRATEDHELFVLDVPPKTFEAAPTVERQSFAGTPDPKWLRSLDDYWDRVVR